MQNEIKSESDVVFEMSNCLHFHVFNVLRQVALVVRILMILFDELLFMQ